MADLASIVATSLRTYVPGMTDEIFDAHPGLWWLRDQGRVKSYNGGRGITEDVVIGKNSTVATRDPKAKIPITEQDPIRQVLWHDISITGALPIFWADERANANRLEDFAQTLLENLRDTVSDTLGAQFYEDGIDDAGEACLQGLESIVGFDNTYGTMILDERVASPYVPLTRVAATNPYPWWMPANGAGTDDYSIEANRFETAEVFALNGGTDGGLQNLYDRCKRGKTQEEPDLILMGIPLFHKFKALILPSLRYRDEKTINAGFPQNLLFDNAVVIMDADCLTAAVYCLNTKHIKLRPDAPCAKKVLIEERAPTSDQFVKTFLAIWKGQMTCNEPRLQGKMTNKT